LFIAHGGGPSFFQPESGLGLGHGSASHIGLLQLREKELADVPDPSAIVIISAHWETDGLVYVNANPRPSLLFDYSGFPKETYQLQYPAPGSPSLADRIVNLLGGNCVKETNRGWDHGVFVPLMVMFPKANIPVVQVSLSSSLDPAFHVELGRRLAPLRDENVLIIGSGFLIHNFGIFGVRGNPSGVATTAAALEFDKWLVKACTLQVGTERGMTLTKWETAQPKGCGRAAHPREEHLIPLHVAAGAGENDIGRVILNNVFFGPGKMLPFRCFRFG